MKSTGAALLAHLASGTTTFAVLVKITRPDGLIYGFTTHDRSISYLGLTYYSGQESQDLTDLTHTSDLAVDDATASGLLNNTITAEQIEAGLWSASAINVYRVNWQNILDNARAPLTYPAQGHEVLGAGELGEVKFDGQKYAVEFMSRTHKLGRTITRAYLPLCDADLGDARCKVDRDALSENGTVTSTADARNFTASAIVTAAEFHTYGKVRWLTGANADREMEIKRHTAGGNFELQLSMYFAIEVGDTFTVWPGCNKKLRTGPTEYLGDCKVKFNNVVNFRGFSQVPGIDEMLKPAGR